MKAIVASFGIAFAVQTFGQERIETAPPPPPEARAEGYGKQYGLIPNVPLVFGPKLTIGFINPSIGIEAKYANLVGLSVDYGFIPDFTVPSTSPPVQVGWSGWNVGAKLYPFRGSFFLGAALGGRTFTGNATDAALGRGDANVTSTYVAPELGWRWVTRSGLFFGMEFGWQFVLSYTAEFKMNGIPVPTSGISGLQDAAKFVGEQGLPILGLFTIGYLF